MPPITDEPFPKGMVEEIALFAANDRSPRGLDLYPELFTTGMFFPLQRQAEMAAMTALVRAKFRSVCVGCDGDGSMSYQWAKRRCVETGGRQVPLGEGGWYYQTGDGKEIPFKTIGLHCTVCKGEQYLVTGPKVLMEIGADKGGGLYHWCKAFPTLERVLAFEIRGTPYSGVFERAFPDIQFWWGCDSHCLDEVAGPTGVVSWLGYSPRIDVLFIDGDKSGMEMDFDVFRPLMKPGAIALFHDITDGGPKEAFDKVAARGYHSKIIHDVGDYDVAREREKIGWPPLNAHEGWLRFWAGRSCGVGVVFIP